MQGSGSGAQARKQEKEPKQTGEINFNETAQRFADARQNG